MEERVREYFLENVILTQNFDCVNAWLKLCSLGCGFSLNSGTLKLCGSFTLTVSPSGKMTPMEERLEGKARPTARRHGEGFVSAADKRPWKLERRVVAGREIELLSFVD